MAEFPCILDPYWTLTGAAALQGRSAAVDFRLRMFSIVEAAEHLRISRSLLYQLISAGKIKPVKIGHRTLIRGAEIERFMLALEEEQ